MKVCTNFELIGMKMNQFPMVISNQCPVLPTVNVSEKLHGIPVIREAQKRIVIQRYFVFIHSYTLLKTS